MGLREQTKQWTRQQKLKHVREIFQLAANEVIQETKIQTEVEELFVDNFSAIGLDEFDYGCNPDFEFDIKLQPGAKPVLHKVRPMNPEQK